MEEQIKQFKEFTKEDFIRLTGENPEDVLGPDYENIMSEWNLEDQ